ncbi:MAG: phosphoenolpyruvate synthase [Candidatus Dependentiae bacterium]|nr:phosphoenolpyruvate synthase [Candidatus Dependentiae bacterium]
MNYIRFFSEISRADISEVGGKNASLGELIQQLQGLGINVPQGFAITAQAFRDHLTANNLTQSLTALLQRIDYSDSTSINDISHEIKSLILHAILPEEIKTEIKKAYRQLSRYYVRRTIEVAVRSSATAEDLPEASFAGQHDSFLYIKGDSALEHAVKACMASLFNARALMYRKEKGFKHEDVALSVGVQKMVRADKACAGVMFTLDPETGFKDVVVIEAGYGLGELVVQGKITPQEFYIYKTKTDGLRPLLRKRLGVQTRYLISTPTGLQERSLKSSLQQSWALNDQEIQKLADDACAIEHYYSKLAGHLMPMDIEWAKDGIDQQLYIVQARPETIHRSQEKSQFFISYSLTGSAPILCTGQSIGQQIVTGTARIITSLKNVKNFNKGDILVTQMTDPDWVPLINKAGAIVTDFGGRTCHAAIVSRELQLPALIGTGNATQVIQDGQVITVDLSQGMTGFIYEGAVTFTKQKIELQQLAQAPVNLLVNLADPDQAFRVSQLPVEGVGLARLEFIISSAIKIHPMSVVHFNELPKAIQKKIKGIIDGYQTPQEFFIDTLTQSISMIAAGFYPRPVIVRLTDFKSNEYANLIGGTLFEPQEENPMLGFRGAVRYISAEYAPAFALECAALHKARIKNGFDNIKIMVPFVRTVDEAQKVVELLKDHGLVKGKDKLELYMMVEIPSNIILFEEFSSYFDGFSIGSNDLTQLTLGVDRDSGLLAKVFDERDLAVKKFIADVIKKARSVKKPIGICGQAPSDYPEFADFLINENISSLSLSVDAIIPFLLRLGR